MRIFNNIPKPLTYTIAVSSFLLSSATFIQAEQRHSYPEDIFISNSVSKNNVQIPPKGTNNKQVLSGAPNPSVKIAGKTVTAEIVVDLSKNVLYHYDKNGNAKMAYSIASGKKSTPTHTGIRKVSHIETYPYRTAPSTTKRRQTPRAFGPKAIILNQVNPKTGELSPTGEFIHGNNNPSSIGKYASHGCMRMDNEVIKDLASKIKSGAIILIKK